MKVFNNFEVSKAQEREREDRVGGSSSQKSKLKERPPKKAFSEGEIRTRVERGLKKREIQEAAKFNTQKTGDTFLNESALVKVKPVAPAVMMDSQEAITKAEDVVIGDVQKNDPSDPVTHGKLKTVLSKGAFSFSEKERDVLAQILQSE